MSCQCTAQWDKKTYIFHLSARNVLNKWLKRKNILTFDYSEIESLYFPKKFSVVSRLAD